MFKIAKSRLLPSVPKQSQVHSHTVAAAHLRRGITTHQMIINEQKSSTINRKDILDMYGQIDGNLGVLKMNREHRFNQLTPNMIENISRGVETMNIDHIITTIYLSTENQQHFCGGTDFRTIAFMKKEDNYGRIKEYLQQIYQLQTQVAKLNKPLITVAPGHCYNSGAALLAATAHPMTTLDAKIAFNEVTFGFVPHSGATYYLSHLPGEFGTFMALTGLPINGSDAAQIELTKGVIHDPKYYAEEVGEYVRSIEFPGQKGSELFEPTRDANFLTPWEQYLYQKYASKDQMRKEDFSRMGRQKMDSSIREDFVEARERTPSSTADAQFNYMQLLREESAKQEVDVGFFEFGKSEVSREQAYIYKNYFADQMGYLASHLGQEFPHSASSAFQHRQLIDRCFFSDAVEEIMANLKKESHPFAKECLRAMERNSMLSMKLALKMLRKATNMDYRKAMEMELHVAFNKIQDADFDLGVAEVLMKPKVKGAREKVAAAFNKKVNDSDLSKYFEESKWSKEINLGIVENALLPTRHYYQRFSDQVRLWLNEESTTQSKIRDDFDMEAKEALREQGIDVRDKALTPEIARNHLRAVLAQERVQEIFNERSEQLMTDTKLREQYFSEIREGLKELQNNQSHFYKQVNQHVATIFEDAYLEKLEKVYQKSKEAHSLEKRRMFVQFKKFLFKSRILTYDNLEHSRLMKQLECYPFQQIHLTEQWDQTFREQEHPYLAQSPIYHISKAVGRVSLTPPELIKSFLTNPQNRSAMTLLTLDKKELLQLQQDILQNPEKYETLLRCQQSDETDGRKATKFNREMRELKVQESEYWFRVINDGMSPLDSFPYAREFEAYKFWADGIEEKAIDTLRFAVNSLLLDAEHAKEYDGRLLSLKGWVNSEKSVKKQKQSSLMGDKSRPLSEIKTALNKVLRADPDFGSLFCQNTANSKIKQFRDECESELLKIVEVALLDKFGYVNKKQLLEERLAQLMNPSSLKDAQLNLIDQYLSLSNGEALVQEAVNVVKPFFIHTMNSKFDAEAQKVLEEFNFEETQPELMMYYFFNLQYPKSMQRGPLARYINFSFKKDTHDTMTAALPFLSASFQRRDLENIIGKQNLDKNQVLHELRNSSMNQTKTDLDRFSTFDANAKKIENDFSVSSEEEKDRFVEFTPGEENELKAMEARAMDLYDFLHFNKYELDNNMTRLDWLHIYSNAILDQGFAFQDIEKSELQIQQLAEYAKFLKDLEIGISKVESVSQEVAQFLAVHDAKNLSQETLYKQVIEERNKFIAKTNSKDRVDRPKRITGAIDDFNNLQKRVESRRKLKSYAVQLAQKLPQETKQDVLDFIKNEAYLNFEQLIELVASKDTSFLKKPNKVIDLSRFIQDNKRSLKLDFKIDAVSLVNARVNIASDDHLDAEMKRNLAALIDSVQDETQYISNADRREISIKDYLQKYHFQSADAYNLYATDLLKSQIKRRLGQIETETVPDVIDWQFAEYRTHPSEHVEETPIVRLGKVADEESDTEDFLQENFGQSQKIYERVSGINKEDISKLYEPPNTEIVQSLNQITGNVEVDTQRDFVYKEVLREARTLTKLPTDMITTKNQFENRLLITMAQADYKESQVKDLIEEYTQIRLKSCMLNRSFAIRVKGDDNGHIFLKVLKEQVVEELGLTQPAEASHLAYNDLMSDKNETYYDLESAYNLQNINNADAMGYDNMMKRTTSASATENFDAAHETVFDKLLADYFLGKRGEYKESNKLMKELADVFGGTDFSDPASALDYKKMKQDIEKVDMPCLEPENFRAMIELDNVTQRAIQHDKNGLSDSLRKLSIKETSHEDHFKTQVPDYFHVFDVRKPAPMYLEDKLKMAIKELFEIRSELEKTMTRRELISFDKVLAKYLQHDVLMPKLKASVDQDYSLMQQGKALVESVEENSHNRTAQLMKTQNRQRTFNKQIKNEDAQFKLLAFNGMLDKNNQALYEQNDDKEAAYSFDNFTQFYKTELRNDQFKPAREMDPSHYTRKKPWELSTEGFKNKRVREEEYFKEHAIYLENKKENQERIQMFYILEQFLEASRTKPDRTSQAQEHIKEYFAEPDNTFFFDKNKIY